MLKLVVAVGGASGAPYAQRFLSALAQCPDVEPHVVFSNAAKQVWAQELGELLPLPFPTWKTHDFNAPFASGSAGFGAMVVIPCSMGGLARIAHGISEDLIGRAADVMLKERRKLVLVARETPLSEIHLSNMLAVTRAGAVVLPAMPSFYGRPSTVEEVLDTVVGRVLDQLGLPLRRGPRWGRSAMSALVEIARQVLSPLDAPASYLRSEIIGPDELYDDSDVDEWVALDIGVARRAGAILRVSADEIDAAMVTEVMVRGLGDARLVKRALDQSARVRAVLATGETGIDAYRAAAAARLELGTRAPIRVRWDGILDVKGAALALTFGADELAGPLAPRVERLKLAQIGGPPEDVRRPSPAYLESLIRAAGRLPVRR